MTASRRERPSVTRWTAALAFACVVASGDRVASAQTRAEKAAVAQALFDEGMRLLRAGHAAEACPKLEESQRLDPGMATQFRLAECNEQTGKIASAWAGFVAVADEAGAAKLTDREAAARKRAAALLPRLPRLTITVAPGAEATPGLEVRRDDGVVAKPVWGVPVPVDPGAHLVVATAPGKRPWRTTVTASETATLSVVVAGLEAAPMDAPPPPAPVARRSYVPGIVLASLAGASAIAGGALFGVHASDQSSAESLSAQIKSSGGSCGHAPDARCGSLASKASSADALGDASTGLFVGAGVLALAAVAYFVWPESKARASGARLRPTVVMTGGPRPGARSAGAALGGSF